MPEPVVIIGPAKGPAGPIGEPAEATDRAELDDTDVPPERQPKKGRGKKSMALSALARLGSGLFMLLARGLLAIAKVGISVVRHHPRHSLAAGASLLILGAIWYTQHFSGTSLRPAGLQRDQGSLFDGFAHPSKERGEHQDQWCRGNRRDDCQQKTRCCRRGGPWRQADGPLRRGPCGGKSRSSLHTRRDGRCGSDAPASRRGSACGRARF